MFIKPQRQQSPAEHARFPELWQSQIYMRDAGCVLPRKHFDNTYKMALDQSCGYSAESRRTQSWWIFQMTGQRRKANCESPENS